MQQFTKRGLTSAAYSLLTDITLTIAQLPTVHSLVIFLLAISLLTVFLLANGHLPTFYVNALAILAISN